MNAYLLTGRVEIMFLYGPGTAIISKFHRGQYYWRGYNSDVNKRILVGPAFH